MNKLCKKYSRQISISLADMTLLLAQVTNGVLHCKLFSSTINLPLSRLFTRLENGEAIY